MNLMGRIGHAIKSASYRLFMSWDEVVQNYDSRRSKSDQPINWRSALGVMTILAGARVLAEGVAQVPWKVFREAEGKKLPATGHPLYRLLHRRPNYWQTSFEFREQMMLHLVLCGNFFAFKNIVNGELVELVPLEPQRVTVRRAPDGSLTYLVSSESGGLREFPATAIWHVRGPSWDGWLGLDIVVLAREAIGLALATEEQHALLHANGISPSGTYSVEGKLDAKQHAELTKWIHDHGIGAKKGSALLLDRSATWLSTGMNGVDAQHVETRRLQIEENCRAIRVMPIMVGHTDKTATYASAEQMFIAHVVHSLSPWYERIDQSADVNLLSEKDQREGYYCRFVAAGLLRGAMKDRGEYFTKALGSGGSPAWMTQDEVRGLDELNPMGGDAAELPIPTNVGGAPANPADNQVVSQGA